MNYVKLLNELLYDYVGGMLMSRFRVGYGVDHFSQWCGFREHRNTASFPNKMGAASPKNNPVHRAY